MPEPRTTPPKYRRVLLKLSGELEMQLSVNGCLPGAVFFSATHTCQTSLAHPAFSQ